MKNYKKLYWFWNKAHGRLLIDVQLMKKALVTIKRLNIRDDSFRSFAQMLNVILVSKNYKAIATFEWYIKLSI